MAVVLPIHIRRGKRNQSSQVLYRASSTHAHIQNPKTRKRKKLRSSFLEQYNVVSGHSSNCFGRASLSFKRPPIPLFPKIPSNVSSRCDLRARSWVVVQIPDPSPPSLDCHCCWTNKCSLWITLLEGEPDLPGKWTSERQMGSCFQNLITEHAFVIVWPSPCRKPISRPVPILNQEP